jgi:hypothetical protein
MTEDATRECPFCKEEIKAGAIKCKHCRSAVKPETPPHRGICPFCKEEIKPEAIKCKHCGSMVDGSDKSGSCEGCAEKGASFQGTSELDISGNFGTIAPSLSLREGTFATRVGCSPCWAAVWDGNNAITRKINPYRRCCRIICFGPFGCRTSCWTERCPDSPNSQDIVAFPQ